MGALELSFRYFRQLQPKLQEKFPDLYPRMAIGMAGNGSECFGYDDEQSRDHDWGAEFTVWLLPEDAGQTEAVFRFLQEQKKLHLEFPFKNRSAHYVGAEVQTTEDFFRGLIGCPGVPQSNTQWLQAPQENLAMTVNGEVFYDGPGAFTATRESLKKGYPEDVRLKKLAARCMGLAQTGQYNYLRSARRSQTVTCHVVLAKFIQEATGFVFLLNREFMPYYKWQQRRLRELPLLGKETADALEALVAAQNSKSAEEISGMMEALCVKFADELRRQNLSTETDNFLALHGPMIQSKIRDERLRALPPQYG